MPRRLRTLLVLLAPGLTAGCMEPDALLGRGVDDGALPLPGPSYALGHIWTRSDLFAEVTPEQASRGIQYDTRGQPTWFYGLVDGDPNGVLIGDAWQGPFTPMVWDASWYGRNYSNWAVADDTAPSTGVGDFIHTPKRPDRLPVIVWTQPLPSPATIHVQLTAAVQWFTQTSAELPVISNPPGSQPGEVVLGRLPTSGAGSPLLREILQPSTSPSLVSFDQVLELGPGEKLVLTGRTSGSAAWLFVGDEWTLTLEKIR